MPVRCVVSRRVDDCVLLHDMAASWLYVLVTMGVVLGVATAKESGRCKNQPQAPPRIERTIAECQTDIKRAILQEVLAEVQGANAALERQRAAALAKRVKREETFDNDERRIAGCLLHCVYRKVKAVDANGFPTLEGLVRLYTEGAQDQDYFNATALGAHKCIAHQRSTIPAGGKELCDVAYDLFECLTNHLDAYCNGDDAAEA